MDDEADTFLFKVDLVPVFSRIVLLEDSSDFHPVYLPKLSIVGFCLSVADLLGCLFCFYDQCLLCKFLLVFLVLGFLRLVAINKLVASHTIFSENGSVFISLVPLLV